MNQTFIPGIYIAKVYISTSLPIRLGTLFLVPYLALESIRMRADALLYFMARPKQMLVKETLQDLKKYLKNAFGKTRSGIQMLIDVSKGNLRKISNSTSAI